jgi:ribonucleoside-diphosphate reductase alpha chain
MCGTGVGFSVERREVEKLPEVPDELFDTDTTLHVADSKIGWAKAYKELISMLYSGQIPKWDMTRIRPAGERLKTFGGRSSGREPLDNLFRFTGR